ncbi:alpha/beta hydrolase [Actinoplanes sp. NBRC 103695]|uniref:alpha/beta fold hydrolase n=1 Tax=Actinoplanes sp. NBRC 103695 TaxID=3032202 RepID=UPI0024A22890|nr:alpha/beta hydrolase [Actinoplanes sp. NBRC 103695]GLZ00828.1 alpha/beta hydrolase [Actinoplanes sp. NBRC 103695]
MLSNTTPTTIPSPRRPRTRHLLTRLALAAALILTGVAQATPAAQAQPLPAARPGCARHDLAVTLTATPGAVPYRLAGWLCRPAHATTTVQVLIPGLTYTHRYWTGLDQRTDYTATALAGGDAVYLIDRISTGASDRPPADQVTATTEATVTHQVIRALRDGTIGRFTRVVSVGHSYGSVIAMAEAATYHDVDALVLTGLLHDIRLDEMTRFITDLHPAAADPKFADTAPPDGYMTTRPGSRPGYFLNPQTAARGATGWDEQTKTTATTGELTFTPDDELAYSRAITVPVLFVMGATDALFCGTGQPCTTTADICQREHTAFPNGTPLAAVTVPRTGHSLNLHRAAPLAFTAITAWLHHQRSASGTPPVSSCRR